MSPKRARGGQPPGTGSKHTPEIAAAICKRLARGESLRSICRDKGMPTEAAVRQWAMEDRNGFASHYAKARELGYLGMFEEMLEIADTPLTGVTVTTKLSREGEMYDETKRADMIEHRRLQVDTRKWALAKMLPKVFGDRVQNDVSVAIGEGETDVLTLAQRIAYLLSAGVQRAEEDSPKPLH